MKCGTCKHFTGAGDWDLCCMISERRLCYKDDDACKKYEENPIKHRYYVVMDEYQPTCKACGFRPFAGYIPSLEWMRERGFKFCPQCGQKVKWNEE